MQLSLPRQLKIEILPLISIGYLFISLAIIISAAIFLDEIVIPYLEDKGKIVAYSWKKENNLMTDLIKKRNLADYACPIWHSQGILVPFRKAAAKRILVMGDSYVFGDGSANINTIWWRQLARELSRRGYNDVEIIACGWDGASTRQELDWARKVVPLYKPDMIIWGYVTNDPGEIDSKTGQDIVPLIHLPEDLLARTIESITGPWFPQLTDQLLDIRSKGFTKRLSGSMRGYEYGEWELQILKGCNFEHYKQTVKKLGGFIKQERIPAFVITLPNVDNEQASAARYSPVQPLFEQAHIPFINNLPAFVALCNQQSKGKTNPFWLTINPANGHPGPIATHFYACCAVDVLEHDFPQILGKKRTGADQVKVKFNDWVPPAINLKRLDDGRFSFIYPQSDDQLLHMPIRKPFIQLNLENAIQLKELKLSGANLNGATIYLSYEDPLKHFDDGSIECLGYKHGSDLGWTFDNKHSHQKINTMRINAQFIGNDRLLLLNAVTL